MAIESNADVAGKVRGIAAERRCSRSDIAETLDLSLMAVSRRLNGSVPFTPTELIHLSRLLGTPVGSFFGEVAAA